MTQKTIYTKKDGYQPGREASGGKSPPAAPKAAPAETPAAPAAPSAAKVLADPPTLEQLEQELKKSRYRANFKQTLRNTLFSLIVVAAVSALVAVLLLPVLQIHGASMAPTLQEGDIVVCLNAGGHRPGDLIAFYYNNNILIKRVIASPGDWVNIDENGVVAVNGEVLAEPYISQPALGSCDISFPYQVPDGRYFVLGDHRETSIDSRSSVMGCISKEMVIGRVMMRAWPLKDLRLFGRE